MGSLVGGRRRWREWGMERTEYSTSTSSRSSCMASSCATSLSMYVSAILWYWSVERGVGGWGGGAWGGVL